MKIAEINVPKKINTSTLRIRYYGPQNTITLKLLLDARILPSTVGQNEGKPPVKRFKSAETNLLSFCFLGTWRTKKKNRMYKRRYKEKVKKNNTLQFK